MAERIALQLAEARKLAGLTQVQLAELLGVDQSTISHIERGSRDTTTAVIERWVAACRALLLIHPQGQDSALSEADRILSERFSRAIGAVEDSEFKEATVRAFERLAVRERR